MQPLNGKQQYGPARINIRRTSPEDFEGGKPPPALAYLLFFIAVLLTSLTVVASKLEYPEKQVIDLVVGTVPPVSTVSAAENGVVQSLLVSEGQLVRKGQKLLLWQAGGKGRNVIEAPAEGSVQLLLALGRGDRIESGEALIAIVPQALGLNAAGYVQVQAGQRLRAGQSVHMFSPDSGQDWLAGRLLSIGEPHVDARRRVEVEFVGDSHGVAPGAKLRGEVIVGTVRFLPRLLQRIRVRGT